MNSCATCTKLLSITEPEEACKPTRSKVTNIRVGCESDLIETISASTSALCNVGYISDVIVSGTASSAAPLINIPISNDTEFDESNSFSYDRDTEVGEDTFSINPLIKIYNDDHDCTLNSLKGQDLVVFFEIEGRNGDWIWRRFKGKLTAIEGGLLNGYTLTIDTLDPSDADRPLFVNIAGGTTAVIDALTTF